MSIYDQNPLTYLQQALMSQQGGSPYYQPEFRVAPVPQRAQYHGPTHQALSQAFVNALQQQLAVPGLLSAMQVDPSLAARIGGFALQSYTPNIPQTGINWNPPPAPPGAAGGGGAASGWLQARGVYPGQNTVDFGSANGGTSADGTSGVGNDGSGSAAAAAGAAAAADAAASGNDGSSGVAW